MTGEIKSDIDNVPLEILQQPLFPGLVSHYLMPIVDAAVSTAIPLLATDSSEVSHTLVSFDLAKIVQDFGINKRRYSGPGAPRDIKEELRPLHTSLSEALDRFRLLSKDARGKLAKYSLLESTLTRSIEEIEPHLEFLLKRGAPSNFPVENAARSLVQLWMHWRPHSYRKTLAIVLGENGEQEFVSEGPRFVGKTLRAIDPAIDLTQIATALRKLPVV